jgi:hypothetical protein
MKIVGCPFEEIIKHHRHKNRSDDQRDHVQEDNSREDGFE